LFIFFLFFLSLRNSASWGYITEIHRAESAGLANPRHGCRMLYFYENPPGSLNEVVGGETLRTNGNHDAIYLCPLMLCYVMFDIKTENAPIILFQRSSRSIIQRKTESRRHKERENYIQSYRTISTTFIYMVPSPLSPLSLPHKTGHEI
jgi:hypothetical protein